MATCTSANVWEPKCDDTGDGGGGDIIPIQIIAITGQLSYPLPVTVIGTAATVHVNGRILSPFDDYEIKEISGVLTLVLEVAVFAGEEILVYSRATVPDAPITPAVDVSNLALPFIFNIGTTDLAGVNNFRIHNYDTLGDNGGSEWFLTGNDIPALKSTINNAKGIAYDITGLECKRSQRQIRPEQFGVKSSNQQANIHIDCTIPMDDMLAFSRLDAPRDGTTKVDKGGYKIVFPWRNEYERSGTMNLVNMFTGIDFNNALIIQTTATRIIKAEFEFADFKNVSLTYADSVTYEQLFNAGFLALEFSADQIDEINSESPFNGIQNIKIDRCFRGIGLISTSPTNAGLVWQTELKRVDILNALDYSYYFDSIQQTSTTYKFQNVHADCNGRDAVTIGAFSYFAKKHMLASNPIQPEVTLDWEDSWDKQPVTGDRPPWVSGKFYRTFGKGYFINNITTAEGSIMSMDGGHNVEEGSVMNTLTGALKIGNFHLESHILYKPDAHSLVLGSSVVFDQLWLGDLRRRLPLVTDRAYLIGGVAGRNRNLTIEQVINDGPHPTDTTGILQYIDGGRNITAFNFITSGSGIPRHLTRNMPAGSEWDRPWDGDEGQNPALTTYGVVTVTGGTIAAVTPTREQEDVEFITTASNTMNVTLDDTKTFIGWEANFFNEVGTVTAINGGTILGTNPSTAGKLVNIKRITATKYRMAEAD